MRREAYSEKRLLVGKCADVAVELAASVWADDTINERLSACEDARCTLLNCHFGYL